MKVNVNCIAINVKLNPLISYYLANIYLFKVNNRNTRKRCEVFSKLTIKTPEPSR